MSRNSRINLSAVAIVVGLGLTASSSISGAGVSSAGRSSQSSSGKITLQYWVRGENGAAQIANKFNASQNKIHIDVTTVADAEYPAKLGAAIRGGHAPDVADIDDINSPLTAATGMDADLTSYVKGLPFEKALNTAQLDLGYLDGKYYTLPFINGASVLMWNKDLFKQAGLNPNAPPTNWAQIESDAKAITKLGHGISGWDIPGSCGGCLTYTVWPMIWASGGQVISGFGKNQKATFTHGSTTVDILTFLHKLWKEGLAAPSDQTQDGTTWGANFEAGKVGILVGTPVFIPPAEKNHVDVGATTIPGQNGGYSTFEGGDNLIALKTTKYLTAVEQFISYCLNQESQTYLAAAWALAPVRSDMLTKSFDQKYPVPAVMIKAAEKGNVPKVIGFEGSFQSSTAPWLTAFQKIVFQGANAASTLSAADSATNTLIKQTYQEQVGQ